MSDPPELAELHFAAGLPGFPATRHFDRMRWGGPESPFVVLTGRDPLKTQFVLVAPDVYFPEYRPAFTAEHLAAVGLDRPEEAVVMVIVTLRVDPGGPTANLLGPLLINPGTGAAVQAVLQDGGWDTTATLVAPGRSIVEAEGI